MVLVWGCIGCLLACPIIQNGDFEDGTLGEDPDGWQSSVNGGGWITEDMSHSGLRSIVMQGYGHGTENSARFTMEAGKEYIVKFWVYSTHGGRIVSRFTYGERSSICYKWHFPPAGVWTEFSYSCTPSESHQDATIRLGLGPFYRQGTFYVDSVQLGCPWTASPTASPTVASAPTSFGDPHLSNLRGERFDIARPGQYAYLIIPRGGGAPEGSLLRVIAKVDPLGALCEGKLFVTSVTFTGQWLEAVGRVESMNFTTSLVAKMSSNSMKVGLLFKDSVVAAANGGAGGAANPMAGTQQLSAAELGAMLGPGSLVEVTDFNPQEAPRHKNEHVTVLLLKLKLGPTIIKLRMVHQKEAENQPTYSNSLWLTATGLGAIGESGLGEVGGLLGLDNHTAAEKPPEECHSQATAADARGAAAALLDGQAHWGTVHAMASVAEAEA